MRKNLLILSFALISIMSYGQYKALDLKAIKSFASSKTYDEQLTRYLTNDTTLTVDEYVNLYYGQALRDDFRAYASHDSVRVLNNYLRKSKDTIDFHKVIYYTTMILKDYPFDIERIFITGAVYDKIGFQDSAAVWFNKYHKLISAILTSGDGLSEKTAFVVTQVADEYAVLEAFRLQVTGQSLIIKKKKHYDLMSVAPNARKIKQLYFNIDLFYGKWK